MAYVRTRGRQILIVHGRRNDAGAVEQQILFTLYSKGEALEMLGKRGKDGQHRFRSLLEHEHPDLHFDWKKIEATVEANLDVLPDLYEYRQERLVGSFRKDLGAFAKSLLLADPQHLVSVAELIASHRHELEFVRGLIDWRLELCDKQERNDWNADNPFYWRFALQGKGVPFEAEEKAAGYYERHEYEMAKAVFQLLCEVFYPYAEGHNYLGLIALDENRLEDAAREFQTTIELGRRLFPKKLAKKHYWVDHKTRPYMRGLQNLAATHVRMARYDDALLLGDRLEQECGDRESALALRAICYLNLRRWKLAFEASTAMRMVWPIEGFVAAFAAFERDQEREALELFLHAALNRPIAARMLLGMRTPQPTSAEEAQDHNEGVRLWNESTEFRARQSGASKRFFKAVLRHPEVERALADLQRASHRWWKKKRPDDRRDFDTITDMRSAQFARRLAESIAGDVLARPASQTAPA